MEKSILGNKLTCLWEKEQRPWRADGEGSEALAKHTGKTPTSLSLTLLDNVTLTFRVHFLPKQLDSCYQERILYLGPKEELSAFCKFGKRVKEHRSIGRLFCQGSE